MSSSESAAASGDGTAAAILAYNMRSSPAADDEGFNKFFEKVVLENAKRPPDRQLMSRNELRSFVLT